MNNDQANKKVKSLIDLAKKIDNTNTNRNYEYKIIAGRQVPKTSLSQNLKTLIVKPKEY